MTDRPSKCDLCGSPEVYEVNHRTSRDFNYTLGYCYPCARYMGKMRTAVRDLIGYYPSLDSLAKARGEPKNVAKEGD